MKKLAVWSAVGLFLAGVPASLYSEAGTSSDLKIKRLSISVYGGLRAGAMADNLYFKIKEHGFGYESRGGFLGSGEGSYSGAYASAFPGQNLLWMIGLTYLINPRLKFFQHQKSESMPGFWERELGFDCKELVTDAKFGECPADFARSIDSSPSLAWARRPAPCLY